MYGIVCVNLRPNKRFHATVLALRARPAREPRRWTSCTLQLFAAKEFDS